MFSETAELYDLIYQQFKDYTGESRRIAGLLERVHPEAKTVLDVACGTGEHARILSAKYGYEVDGLDLEPSSYASLNARIRGESSSARI